MSDRRRRGYIDWLRGIGVLVMVEAHAFDSWTMAADRVRPAYAYAMILGGFAAPMFLFLAGASLAFGIAGRISRGDDQAGAVRRAMRRGWQILGLAFLFRLQSWILSGGVAPLISLLKVDILNIMGIALAATAALWGLGRTTRSRFVLLSVVAVVIAMTTPIVRAASWPAPLPDPIESYLRPLGNKSTFAIFPWAGFVFAGAAVGLLIERAWVQRSDRRLQWQLGVAGPVIALVAYGASFLPPIYAQTSFWTSSPTFFFLRLGILVTLLPLAYAWSAWTTGEAGDGVLSALGTSSLFVYWIHVEMVYGIMSYPLRRRLPLEQMVVAYVVFVVWLYLLTRIKQVYTERRKGQRPPAVLTNPRVVQST